MAGSGVARRALSFARTLAYGVLALGVVGLMAAVPAALMLPLCLKLGFSDRVGAWAVLITAGVIVIIMLLVGVAPPPLARDTTRTSAHDSRENAGAEDERQHRRRENRGGRRVRKRFRRLSPRQRRNRRVLLEVLLVAGPAGLVVGSAAAAAIYGLRDAREYLSEWWYVTGLAALTAAVIALVHLVVWRVKVVSPVLQELGREQMREEESIKKLRESTRGFAAFLEDQYSWVLRMPDLEQKKRALQRYQEIVSRWEEENRRFHALRGSDHWDLVTAQLGEEAGRAIEIWERRRELYQYAAAYSTEPMRAQEIAEIEEQIQQIKVEAAGRKEKFAKRLRKAGGLTGKETR